MRALLLAVTAVIALAGCGSSAPAPASSDTPPVAAATPTSGRPSSGATSGLGDTAASNNRVPQRVYTAIPDGDDEATMMLCDDLFSGAGVTPQAS
jgi:predicted small lipoprotein YifL